MKIQEITADKNNDKPKICEQILRALPQWFGIEQAIIDYIRDVEEMPMFVVVMAEKIVGFISLKTHNCSTAEVYVIGVLPEYHRQGLGEKLIDAAEEYLKNKKFKFLTVKTLSPLREDKNYVKTRKFYERMGFFPLEEFKTLWDESNPCLFMAKFLN